MLVSSHATLLYSSAVRSGGSRVYANVNVRRAPLRSEAL